MKSKSGVPIKKLLWATDFSNESKLCLPYIKYFSETIKVKNYALYVLPKFSDWVYEAAFFSNEDLHREVEKTKKKSKSKILGYNSTYKLDFKAMVPLSIFFDREGNHLALTPAGEIHADSGRKASSDNSIGNISEESQKGREEITAYDLLPVENGEESTAVDPSLDPKKNISQMANKIALMISEINGEQGTSL